MIERRAQDEELVGDGGGKFSVFKSSKSLAYLLARKEIKKKLSETFLSCDLIIFRV